MFKSVFLLSALILMSCSASTQKPEEITVQPVPSRSEQVLSYSRFGSAKVNSDLQAAWRLYRAGKFRQSAKAFEDILSGGYVHYDVAFGAGLSYMKYFDKEKALRYFSQTVSLSPSHFEALYLMAEIKKQNKDFVSARSLLEKILSMNYGDKLLCGLTENDYLSVRDFEKRKKDSLIMLKQM